MRFYLDVCNCRFTVYGLRYNQSNEWFDGELAEQISNRDKPFKKFKKSKFHIDELIYKEAKNTVQRLIKEKKKKFFSKKLEENIGEPKELWKNLKNLAFQKQRLLHRIFA